MRYARASSASGSAELTRRAEADSRGTKETVVGECLVCLDGKGLGEASTGLPFFDHMLDQLGRHSGWDLSVSATGDLHVDAHHTVEDVGIVIGEALAEALGDKAGVRRFASISLPLDEALVDVALDLSGRAVPGVRGRSCLPSSSRSATRPSTRSWQRSSSGHSRQGRPSLFTCAWSPDEMRTTCSRPPSKESRAASTTRYASSAKACPPPRERSATKSSAEVIAVVDYGIGNLRSAEKALVHLGADARLVSDPDEVAAAAAVVLPGVGAFGRCSEALRSTGLDARCARQPSTGDAPFLGICIGFQLLFEGSDEDPSAVGLGVLGGVVRSLPPGGETAADAVEPPGAHESGGRDEPACSRDWVARLGSTSCTRTRPSRPPGSRTPSSRLASTERPWSRQWSGNALGHAVPPREVISSGTRAPANFVGAAAGNGS